MLVFNRIQLGCGVRGYRSEGEEDSFVLVMFVYRGLKQVFSIRVLIKKVFIVGEIKGFFFQLVIIQMMDKFFFIKVYKGGIRNIVFDIGLYISYRS